MLVEGLLDRVDIPLSYAVAQKVAYRRPASAHHNKIGRSHLVELTGRLASRKYSHRDLRWVSTPWGCSRRLKSPGFRINTHPTSQPYGRALRDSLLGNSGGTAPDSHRTSFTAVVNGTQSHWWKRGQSGGQSPPAGLFRVTKRLSGGPGEPQATFTASS